MNSGIYQIKNLITNDIYIGSSFNIEKRWKVHKRTLSNNTHYNIYLQRVWNKYKNHNFVFEIIEICNDLLVREQYYLDILKPKYNLSLHSSSPMKGRTHSKAAKYKMSIAHKGNTHSKGRKYSFIEKLAMSMKRTGTKCSDKTKQKMRNTAIKLERYKDLMPYINSIKRSVIDSNGNLFKSATECAKFWNISNQTVCDILKGRHTQTRKKISFKYA